MVCSSRCERVARLVQHGECTVQLHGNLGGGSEVCEGLEMNLWVLVLVQGY